MGSKFWIEDFHSLFDSYYIVPTCKMNIEEQMNCMTRIVFILFIILLFSNVTYDILFLSVCLLLIISVYYGVKYTRQKQKTDVVETYGKVQNVLEPVPKTDWNSYTNDFIFSPIDGNPRKQCDIPTHSKSPLVININNNNPNLIDTHSSLAFCSEGKPFEDTVSLNQSLVGPPNPRTLVRPIIPNPIYDFSVWQPNDFIIPNAINDQKRQELYQNGYVSVQQIDKKRELPEATPRSKEFFEYQQTKLPFPLQENYSHEYQNYSTPSDYYNQTNYNEPDKDNYIDKQCGYDPNNLKYNLPINYQSSFCQKKDDMKEYNENLFSIPIQPGIYTKSQVNQPFSSMSNLGISQDQQFLPTIPSYDNKNGVLTFTEYDPKNVEPVQNPPYMSENFGQPLRSEIYDPRLTGYGTSYRSYIDPMTGQPRYYYDDIDQITQPNYITRNNLDTFGFASKIGTPNTPTLQGQDLRDAAQSNYTDNQILYRTELQQRLMQKNNNREWQQRIAPISTNNTFNGNRGGTMSSFYR